MNDPGLGAPIKETSKIEEERKEDAEIMIEDEQAFLNPRSAQCLPFCSQQDSDKTQSVVVRFNSFSPARSTPWPASEGRTELMCLPRAPSGQWPAPSMSVLWQFTGESPFLRGLERTRPMELMCPIHNGTSLLPHIYGAAMDAVA